MEPHFVVISPGFEGDDARPLRWLGRIVARMDNPAASYAPFEVDMSPMLSRFVLKPMFDMDAVVFAKAMGDKRLELDFMKWVQVAAGADDKKTIQIHSPRIATFSLQQHSIFLEDIKGNQEVLEPVLDLLRRSERKAYMIVGVKLLYDAVIKLASGESKSHSVGITAPMVEAAMIATGVPLGALIENNPRGAFSSSQEATRDVTYTLQRPRIFAFEYREVTYKKLFMRRLSDQLRLSIKPPVYKKQHYVFSPEKSPGSQSIAQTDQEPRDEPDELVVKDTAISITDINENDDWETFIVEFDGNEDASCVLVYEVKEDDKDTDIDDNVKEKDI